MMAGTVSRAMASPNTEGMVSEFLKGIGGGMLTAARKMAIGVGEAAGLGDIGGAITKVTGYC